MISLSMSAVILILFIISPILNKRYSAKWRYFVWLILAVRLIIPFKVEFGKAPVNLPAPQNQTVVFRTEGIPFAIVENRDNISPSSADYAPVITIKELIGAIWGIGAIIFLLYHILSYILFKRKIMPYCNTVNTDILQEITADMKIKSSPKLFKCGKIASPMMIGFIRPVILLSDADYSDNELRIILKHELTHYKRCDLWYKLLLVIANSVHWFNPLIYLMARRANRDLEYSCDDAVIKNCDMNYRKTYSMAILKAMKKGETTTFSTYLGGGAENEQLY